MDMEPRFRYLTLNLLRYLQVKALISKLEIRQRDYVHVRRVGHNTLLIQIIRANSSSSKIAQHIQNARAYKSPFLLSLSACLIYILLGMGAYNYDIQP